MKPKNREMSQPTYTILSSDFEYKKFKKNTIKEMKILDINVMMTAGK